MVMKASSVEVTLHQTLFIVVCAVSDLTVKEWHHSDVSN